MRAYFTASTFMITYLFIYFLYVYNVSTADQCALFKVARKLYKYQSSAPKAAHTSSKIGKSLLTTNRLWAKIIMLRDGGMVDSSSPIYKIKKTVCRKMNDFNLCGCLRTIEWNMKNIR